MPNALRLKTQSGGGELTNAQTQAFNVFSECVKSAWIASTIEPFSDPFPQLIAQFITIAVFDTDGTERQTAIRRLQKVVAENLDAETAISSLENVIAELMRSRGGADSAKLRKALLGYEVGLAAPPSFVQDVEHVKQHSLETAEALDRYEIIEATEGNRVSIQRECQPLI